MADTGRAERVQISVLIQEETRYRLALEKVKQRRPLNELVEEALQTWLDQQDRKHG